MIEEVWKDIDGYNGVYRVSNLGRVKSIDRINGKGARIRGKVLKARKNNSGYLAVHLYNGSRKSRKVHYIHRLVAQAFLENEGETVNHKDGVKINNSVDNLEWISHSENIIHAYKKGLVNRTGKVDIITPLGEKVIMNTFKSCSKYFGFEDGWIQHRVKMHGKSFSYNGHTIEVK